MFTGIIERTLRIEMADDQTTGRRLTLRNVWHDVAIGESIAVNGVCLTVAACTPAQVMFDIIPETLRRTNLVHLMAGDSVNVERSLRMGGRVDGHFVQGHVDGTGVLVKRVETPQEWRYTIEAPESLEKYLAPKGSICLDGTSLTIAAVHGRVFDVALIPTTLSLTTLASRNIGYAFNLEADMIAKQIVTFLEFRNEQANRTSET